MRIDFVTIFPRMFDAFLAEGVIARGVKQGLLDIRVWDLRDYTTDRHRSTDDEAYGGGPGMVMLGEPVFRAVEATGVVWASGLPSKAGGNQGRPEACSTPEGAPALGVAPIASTARNTGSPSITIPGPPP
jgi:hypothetical protein